MTSIDLLVFMGELGGRFTPDQAQQAEAYFDQMIKDGRVIAIYKDGVLHGILAFSLCSNFIPYWKKETWDYRQHEDNGKTLYIEIMASRSWTKELRKTFQQEILNRHPQIEEAIWHRWASWGDRKVTWRKQWAMK